MNREEHLRWAKDRAIKIIKDRNNPVEAWASFASDMNKHDELRDHLAISLGMLMCINGRMQDPMQALNFIEGFN